MEAIINIIKLFLFFFFPYVFNIAIINSFVIVIIDYIIYKAIIASINYIEGMRHVKKASPVPSYHILIPTRRFNYLQIKPKQRVTNTIAKFCFNFLCQIIFPWKTSVKSTNLKLIDTSTKFTVLQILCFQIQKQNTARKILNLPTVKSLHTHFNQWVTKRKKN